MSASPDSHGLLASRSGGAAFPQFPTSSAWQFDWAVWYSRVQPQRPAQFTQQAPDVRVPFWAFPHASVPVAVSTALVSALYDQAVAAALVRIAAAEGGASGPGGIFSNAWRVAAIVLMIVLIATVAGFAWYRRSTKAGLDGMALRQAEYGSVE